MSCEIKEAVQSLEKSGTKQKRLFCYGLKGLLNKLPTHKRLALVDVQVVLSDNTCYVCILHPPPTYQIVISLVRKGT